MKEKQKVKLCYTVNFEEVPSEISKFLQKSLDLNKRVATGLEVAKQKTSANGSVQFVLSSVLSARTELVKIDQVLEDTADLLRGYEQDLQQEGLDSAAKTIETIKERGDESDEESDEEA